MTFVFCGFVFDSSDEKTRQMPVASEDWVPHPGAKITSSITTVKGATIQSTTTAWMSPYSRTAPPDRGGSNNNNNNNNNGVVILDGCRPPAATTARRFFRWFSRLGQPPIGKTGKGAEGQNILATIFIFEGYLKLPFIFITATKISGRKIEHSNIRI